MTGVTVSLAPHSRWLPLARALWAVIVAFGLGLYVLAIPTQLAYYTTVCASSTCPADQLTPTALQQLQRTGLSLNFFAGYLASANTGLMLVFALVAVVIFWRKSNDWMGTYASLAMILFGLTFFTNLYVPLGDRYSGLVLPVQVLTVLGSASFNILLYLFPNGSFVPRWTAWLVPLVILREAVRVFRPELDSDWYFYLEVGSGLFAQAFRYWRVSNAVQRQQTKWVVFGIAIGASGFLSVIFLVSTVWAGPTSNGLGFLAGVTAIYAFVSLVPISVAIAILRSHLWDIDILIRRTLIYGALTALLALIYLGVVVALQAVFMAVTGQQRSELVTVLSTLVIAALFVPLRNRVQALIDRRYYRRKYDAARTLARFGATLRDEVNLDELTAHLLSAVDETMQPESVELWLVKR